MARQRVAVALATWFYTGYAPGAPGTAGSLCAWAMAWFLVHRCGMPAWALALCAAALAPIAIWSASVAAEAFESRDPARVVVDEVVGQWIALAPVEEGSWWQWIAAIALFRLFDIGKPFGIRRLERLPGGLGVVADDTGAGACAMIGVLLIRWIGL